MGKIFENQKIATIYESIKHDIADSIGMEDFEITDGTVEDDEDYDIIITVGQTQGESAEDVEE